MDGVNSKFHCADGKSYIGLDKVVSEKATFTLTHGYAEFKETHAHTHTHQQGGGSPQSSMK